MSLSARLRQISETQSARFVMVDIDDLREAATLLQKETAMNELAPIPQENLKQIADAVAEHANFRRTEPFSLWETLAELVIGFATVPAYAFVLFKYWAWFAEPIFHVPLSFAGAIGLRFVAAALMPKGWVTLIGRTLAPIVPDWAVALFGPLLAVPIALLSGWLYLQLIS